MVLAVTNDELEQIVFIADSYKQMSRITGVPYPTISRQCRGIIKHSRGKIKFVNVKETE